MSLSMHPVAWPELSNPQRTCVNRLIGHSPLSTGSIEDTQVISNRAGVNIRLTADDGTKYLIKLSQDAAPDDVENEARILTMLGHPYAERVQGFATERHTAALLLHWINPKSLSTRWSHLSAKTTTSLRHDLQNIITGVSALHRCNIVHGDLQPTHIRFTANGEVTVIDFGISGTPQTPFGTGLIHVPSKGTGTQ